MPQARVAVKEWARHKQALPDREWDFDDLQRNLQTVVTWHRHDWGQLDARLRSSIVEGVSVFLSLFDQPDVADAFCPPKSAYREGRPHRGRWALPPVSDALECGKVLALNLPIGANPALGRAIGVMLKQGFQRAVLARIPRMDAEPERPWRDIAFFCDEYQNFVTVGESDPGGDEKFFSLSRQAQLVALVATQSISSLRPALPAESWRTLLQTFRTRHPASRRSGSRSSTRSRNRRRRGWDCSAGAPGAARAPSE